MAIKKTSPQTPPTSPASSPTPPPSIAASKAQLVANKFFKPKTP